MEISTLMQRLDEVVQTLHTQYPALAQLEFHARHAELEAERFEAMIFCKIKLESGTDAHTRQRVAADEEVFKHKMAHLTAQATYKAAHGSLKALECEYGSLRSQIGFERSLFDQQVDFPVQIQKRHKED